MVEARYLGLVRRELVSRAQVQESKIISKLVSKYRSGSITTEDLHGGIGEITALRNMQSLLEVEIGRNAQAQRELLNGTSNEEDSPSYG